MSIQVIYIDSLLYERGKLKQRLRVAADMMLLTPHNFAPIRAVKILVLVLCVLILCWSNIKNRFYMYMGRNLTEVTGTEAEKSSPTEVPDPVSSPRPHTDFPDVLGRCTQSERLQLLEEQCKMLPHNEINMAFVRELFIDEEHKLVACLPPKSGCTTWKAILANNSRVKPLPSDYDVMTLHRESYTRKFRILKYIKLRNKDFMDKVLYDNNYTRFLVTRHPFDRVYSAYLDKLYSGKDPDMQRIHGSRILNLFHPELDLRTRNEGRGATFKEFVDYIKLNISKEKAWEHWDAVYDICQPCHIKYDYILKTETLDDDNRLVIRGHLGPYYRGIGTAGNVLGGKEKHSSLTAQGKVLSAYSALNASDIQYLENRFHKDFQLFGYSWKIGNNTEGKTVMSTYCRTEDGRCC